jgi:flagellar biosynthetic protein FliO
VTAQKKKIVVVLGMLVVGSCLLAARGSRSTASEARPGYSKLEPGGLFGAESDSNGAGDELGTGKVLFKTMVYILVVAALGAAVIYVSKKLGPRITNGADREIHVLETTHLGPRKMLHLIRIGEQKLLVGSTAENITMLAEVTGSVTNTLAGAEHGEAFCQAEFSAR